MHDNELKEYLCRIERKIDLILQLEGHSLAEIAEVINAKADEKQQLKLIEKLAKSGGALKAAIAANQPK